MDKYEAWTLQELRERLKIRGARVSGRKKESIARFTKYLLKLLAMASSNPPLPWMYKARETDSDEVKSVVSVATDRFSTLENCSFDVETLQPDGVVEGAVPRRKGTLQVCFNESTLMLLDRNINVSEIRYAILHTIEPSVGVLISWMNNETLHEEYPVYMYNYILPQVQRSAIEAVEIVNAVRYMKYMYIQRCLSVCTEEIATALDFYTPLFMEHCKCNITSGSLITAVSQQDNFHIIIDKECISFFKQQYDNQACISVFLWDEIGGNVLEKVLCMKDEEVVKLIIGNQTTIELPMNNEATRKLMKIMNQVSSIAKTGFRDAHPLLRHVRNALGRSKLNEKSKARERSPTLATTWVDDSTKIARARERSPTLATTWVDDSTKFARELRQAENECGKMDPEVLENINIRWVVAENEMIQLISGGLVPEPDFRSGGLDENSADHFSLGIKHVEDLLNQEKYDVALSQIQGIKEYFRASNVIGINEILGNDDIALLRKIFFRSFIYG